MGQNLLALSLDFSTTTWWVTAAWQEDKGESKASLHLGILRLGGTCRGAGLTMRGSETASSFLPLQLAW